ncbi:hypothetical protein CC1G_11383 [Coprinopsis cinerea okayama7|uniref:DUF6533 domain-containing protein n=1 Tax=Coprinopsis cinerea (strain Okayama-7 / 130 / ATCC MYA-4618 / FGSC 9003) TaxID=240176 RepID=A8PGH5_COPC7|nr:hypothetical protein CC1G_11383 [Coprinopsis cinerea okayama7\|eukprot:XP_001841220.2 hypothetical protein CC1G_11383 [Coprinopsis cinerea okayama7\
MASQAEFEQLVSFLKIAQEGNYSTAAGLSLLTFDVFSTFQDEVRYIWRSRWSVAKVAYLLARYWALVFMIVILAAATSKHSVKYVSARYEEFPST